MTTPSHALASIQTYFAHFRESVERARKEAIFRTADWQDAYARLARLRERYLSEAVNLTRAEGTALSKVFEHDVFIEGMMQMRQVAEHIHRRETFIIRRVDNSPMVFGTECSAGAVFSSSAPTLVDTDGQPHLVDHLKMLQEAEGRIAKAIDQAQR